MLKNMQEVLEYGFEVLNEVYFNGELLNNPASVSLLSGDRKPQIRF